MSLVENVYRTQPKRSAGGHDAHLPDKRRLPRPRRGVGGGVQLEVLFEFQTLRPSAHTKPSAIPDQVIACPVNRDAGQIVHSQAGSRVLGAKHDPDVALAGFIKEFRKGPALAGEPLEVSGSGARLRIPDAASVFSVEPNVGRVPRRVGLLRQLLAIAGPTARRCPPSGSGNSSAPARPPPRQRRSACRAQPPWPCRRAD